MVIDAMAALARRHQRFAELELVVLGDGPLRDEFEQYSRSQGVCATFHGKVSYDAMLRTVAAADIAVNPIVAGSMGSVLNKVGDYAAAGVPVVNTQESPEYRQLLERYGAGINCRTGNAADVADALAKLLDDPELRTELGRNNRRMAQELFDRNTTYEALARNVVSLAQGQI